MMVPKHDVITVVNPAVDLDDQTQRHTGGIDGVAPQTRPYPLLGEAGGLAKIAGVFLLPLREKVARRAG